MKYTIEGFSQEHMLAMGLDAVDAVILRWFVDFYPMMKKRTEGEIEFGWVAFSHLAEDLPLIRIENKEALGRRFKRLCEQKVLIGTRDYSDGSKTYFAFGEAYPGLVSYRLESREVGVASDSKVGRLPTQKSNNPSSIDPRITPVSTPAGPALTLVKPVKKQAIVLDFATSEWEGITDEMVERWGNRFPACDIELELGKMAEWCKENGARGRKTHWGRFIVNWLIKAQDRGGSQAQGGGRRW